MSIGFLQQDDNIVGQYFQRAIMQSNPYGFEYPSYEVAKDRSKEFTADTSLDEIMASQETALNGLEQLKNWLLSSLSLSLNYKLKFDDIDEQGNIKVGPNSDKTPMSTLMPFAPYILCKELETDSDADEICVSSIETPIKTDFAVSTVLGNNASESNSFGMLFNVTFLVPTIIEYIKPELNEGTNSEELALSILDWLSDEDNVAMLETKMGGDEY